MYEKLSIPTLKISCVMEKKKVSNCRKILGFFSQNFDFIQSHQNHTTRSNTEYLNTGIETTAFRLLDAIHGEEISSVSSIL